MGKHFDRLVDLVRHEIVDCSTDNVPSIKSYFEDLIRRTALFEMPLKSEEIRPHLGKDLDEYSRMIYDYLRVSRENHEALIMPFPVTAVEDDISVVFFDRISEASSYNVSICRYAQEMPEQPILTTLISGTLVLGDPEMMHAHNYRGTPGLITPTYYGFVFGNNNQSHPYSSLISDCQAHVFQDLSRAAQAFIEQIIYIMDPSNFIIQKESNCSLKQRMKKDSKSRREMLRKTVVRPHYIVLSEEDTRDFLLDQSKEPRPAHPVRGHWRRFQSERYVNMKGQSIFIRQYFTGKGHVVGLQGWNYQVMVKESPTVLRTYEG
jgi:hypothetical protein